MFYDYFKNLEWKESRTQLVITIGAILIAGYFIYSDYKEKEEIREHNAVVYKKFQEIRKDYKLLKVHVKEFESSRWKEAVPDVQDMTQILGKDLHDFNGILKQTPLKDYNADNEDND